MKLLMITGDRSLAEGKRGAFYNTLEEFHKYWDRIDIICPAIATANCQLPPKESLRDPVGQATTNYFGNVYIHPSPWPLIFQPWWIFKMGRQLYCEHKFDLITVHEYAPFYNGIGARLLWGRIRTPYILEIHHIPGYPKAADLKDWVYKTATRCFIKYDATKATAVRVVNQQQTPEFLTGAGVPKEKIIYIPSMYIDLGVFKPLSLPKKYDLIFVGRLARNKGIEILLEAVVSIKMQKSDVKLLIVGDGPLKQNLKFKIENLKLQNNVVLYGWAGDSQEVARSLNESRILVMPSYNEGGPRVVLESMACGVPVLATQVGIVSDIIKDKRVGVIVGWRASDIAERALELLENKAEYEKYNQSGVIISRQFEKSSAIRNYAEKLQELVATHNALPPS